MFDQWPQQMTTRWFQISHWTLSKTRTWENKLIPRFYFGEIPYISQDDTLGYKIEALRYYLEKMMGFDHFLAVYRHLMEESDHGANEVKIEP